MTELRQEQRNELGTRLTAVLADTYVLYNTTQFCHWNVVGPQFHSLHEMFEQQYRSLAEAVDLVAERIRVLGFYTPGTLADYLELSGIEQQPGLHAPEAMLRQLIAGHDQVIDRIGKAIDAVKETGDEATLDMLIERLRDHQKTAWMLKSQAGTQSEFLAREHVFAGATAGR